MINMPEVKMGIVAVSRDCFPIELSRKRKNMVVAECAKKRIPLVDCETIVENECDVLKALDELNEKGVNALVVYLGNFGPEGPLSMLAELFDGPSMLVGSAEETKNDLIDGRGDAFCGMLNASYNMALRYVRPYIPEYPVGLPAEIADKIADFMPTARVLLGVGSLKIFSFGPRPQDFLACNAPVKPLYDLGIEIMENSELDLLDIFNRADNPAAIEAIARDMAKELGHGNNYPDMLIKLARYEYALLKFVEDNLGASEYGILANKCWPAFEKYFGFVPCYVNSRLAGRGIPVSCEVDIYGALSEYMVSAATDFPATLLDINNTVPPDMIEESRAVVGDYKPTDLFMGFHCGNTASSCMATFALKHQIIMKRLMEPESEPDITRGTLDGIIRPGDITIFRLQGTADTELRSYVAQGEVLDIDPRSHGSIGVFAVREMGRFYRHVLIGKQFPHHTAVGFKHAGKALFNAVTMLGIDDISHNHPHGVYYPDENPYG
ncbi:fucose isomerase [bacterium]|nr:fucose isomerase [bacterium]